MKTASALLLLSLAAGVAVAGVQAQARAGGKVEYDGRFMLARLRFGGDGLGSYRMSRSAPWAHDYPRAERNLMRILDDVTAVAPHLEGSTIVTADDPDLFKFPVAYIAEPGYWRQSETEVEGLRNYLRKGGFLIVDDFRGADLYNFQREVQRVLPGARLVELDATHQVFNSFFAIESLPDVAPTYQGYQPVYLGIFEENDPAGRLMVVVNYNNDIGDYWEYSDTGWMPVELSNGAYKLGINYIVYAMTH